MHSKDNVLTDIHHYVFDIGRVLVHYDPDIVYQAIIPDEDERRWFFENVCTHEWNLEQDRGRSWEQAEEILIDEHPDWEMQIKSFRANWRDMAPHSHEKSVNVLETLIDGGADVTLLTNFASDTFREAQEKYPFLTKTRGVTVSGDIQIIKPDPAIFAHHAESFDLEPTKIFFIDDSKPNVDAANAAGWTAMHFVSPEQFERDVSAYMPK